MRPLPRSFYLRPARAVARDLLGARIVRTIGGKRLVAKIVEVEAYLGASDPASHAFRGMTKRNEVMFKEGGRLYVYFTYGMHFCANVVTGKAGDGQAVLIRAVEPLSGIPEMRRRRKGAERPEDLTNGPAKFCQAFGIARAENGADLRSGDAVRIAAGERIGRRGVVAATRVGIRLARERRWRYYIRGNAFVSRP